MKEIQPWVNKIKAAYPEVAKLDNDGLRAKTQELKQYIHDSANKERAKVEELKASIETVELEDREEIFTQIDKLEKEILEIYEKALDEVLPVAFSIVKDTARRFTETKKWWLRLPTSTVHWLQQKTSYASKATRLSIRITGMPAVTTRYGT